jgi:hypothetical protein
MMRFSIDEPDDIERRDDGDDIAESSSGMTSNEVKRIAKILLNEPVGLKGKLLQPQHIHHYHSGYNYTARYSNKRRVVR